MTEHTSVGTRLITLVATDKDKGDNGTVRYIDRFRNIHIWIDRCINGWIDG